MALSAIASCAADAVHIGLRHIGQIIVKDMGHSLDINAAGRHIGGHEYMDTTRPKGGKCAVALALILVTVDGLGIHALGTERFFQTIGAVLGAGKDNGLIHGLGLEQSHQGLGLVALVGKKQGLLNLGNGLGGGGHRDLHRVGQKFLAQTPNFGRHGGGKEGCLTRPRQLTQNLLNGRKKAEVHHLVGLIQHDTAGLIKPKMTRLHVVHESARCRHQNIQAQDERTNLRARLRTTDHQANPHLQRTSETL